MLTSKEREYITPRLIKVLDQLIKEDALKGVELDVMIEYMGIINRMVYTKEEAIPFLKELCDNDLIRVIDGKYYPV